MNIVIEIFVLILHLLWVYIESFVKLFLPVPTKNVSNKVVVITGAGRGFGKEMAIQLARLGARLALVDIDENSVSETAALIRDAGRTAQGYKCDVTKLNEVKELGSRIRRDFVGIDILINNAGIMNGKSLAKLTEQDIRRTFEINTLAHFWTVKEFLPGMISSNSGHVVCISSMAGKEGTSLLTDYCASKFAVHGFMEALGVELYRQGHGDKIQLTTVYPMAANTRLVTDIDHYCQYKSRFDPLLSPEEVATAVVQGMLRNQRYVYIPSRMKLVTLLGGLIPAPAKKVLHGFIQAGFIEKTSEEM